MLPGGESRRGQDRGQRGKPRSGHRLRQQVRAAGRRRRRSQFGRKAFSGSACNAPACWSHGRVLRFRIGAGARQCAYRHFCHGLRRHPSHAQGQDRADVQPDFVETCGYRLRGLPSAHGSRAASFRLPRPSRSVWDEWPGNGNPRASTSKWPMDACAPESTIIQTSGERNWMDWFSTFGTRQRPRIGGT